MLMPEGTPRMARRHEHAASAEEPQINVIQLAGYQQQQPPPDSRGGWNRSKAK